MEDKKGAGHSLYMDNFYNSVGLSEQLLQEKVYTTETLRANGAGNPKEVISKKLNKGETCGMLAILESLLPPPAKPEKQSLHHLPEYCPKEMNGKAKRRRCKHCWEVTKIRKDTVYFCPQCPSGPGLCLTPCFRNFHEQ
nr:unnamed protein product [Callosobruchus analis]